MSDDLPPIRKILSQLGLAKSLQRIKFGGVVGKQTLLGIAGVGGLAFIAWKVPSGGLLIAGMATVVILAIAILNFVYANRHPAEAMMEGTEMLAFQHQVLAAKFIEPPKDSPVVPNPSGTPPQARSPEGIDT